MSLSSSDSHQQNHQSLEILPPGLTPEHSHEMGAINFAELGERAGNAAMVAWNGLRRYITAVRLAWTTETLEDHREHDHVIRSMPGEVEFDTVRTFGSPPETPDVVPIRLTEKLASWLRQRQAQRLHTFETEQYHVAQIYGSRTPAPARTPTSYSPEAIRWEEQRQKRATAMGELVHDLGSEEHRRRLVGSRDERVRMRSSHRTSELSAAARHSTADRKIRRIERRWEKGAEGRTLPGQVRSARISRTERRRDRLEARLEHLRQQAQALHSP